MRTRPVNRQLYTNYLKKSEEFLEAARNSFSRGFWNSCAANSVHSGISASDALSVFFKEVRSAGENHEDAVTLLRSLDMDKQDIENKIKQLQRLLQIKNAAEYEEKLMSERDAENSLRDAERFFEWVKAKLSAK